MLKVLSAKGYNSNTAKYLLNEHDSDNDNVNDNNNDN